MAKLYLGTREVTPAIYTGGRYKLLQRIKDDSNNDVGTVCGFFTDGNNNEYAVVCLDAQYRLTGADWCSGTGAVPNMPMYSSWEDNWLEAKETATYNCDLILAYCAANGYTSFCVSGCRNNSFVINGTTYYGQLPNMVEVVKIFEQKTNIENLDPTASTYTSTNFSSSRYVWSSTQLDANNGWYMRYDAVSLATNKTSWQFTVPILELPNDL